MNHISHIKIYPEISHKVYGEIYKVSLIVLRQIYNLNNVNKIKKYLPELEYNKKLQLLREFDEHKSIDYTFLIQKQLNYCKENGYDNWSASLINHCENVKGIKYSHKSYNVKFPEIFWILNFQQIENISLNSASKTTNYKNTLNYKVYSNKYNNFITDLDEHNYISKKWTEIQTDYILKNGLENWLKTPNAINGYNNK